MKRRPLLFSLASAASSLGLSRGIMGDEVDYVNPYEEVDWSEWNTVPSMSHQHQGMNDASRELFRDMGYGHFAFSNYYPSAPTILPSSFRKAHPGISWAPNAEQHSFLDSGLHFNSLGSRLATGYGNSLSAAQRGNSPVVHRFEGLHPFEETRPWRGVYRLDLQLEKAEASTNHDPRAILSVERATKCARRESFPEEGPIRNHPCQMGSQTLYLRAESDSIELTLDYDPDDVIVTQCRLMQGTNRPWRDVFRAALDGENLDGTPSGGLLYPEGGGITINHPTGDLEDYAEMLDFDPRVIGIEVWNQLTSGFGSDRGFYDSMAVPPSHFYQLWDRILATGRRCWGFFVKDHNTYGRGRNILLVPPLSGRSETDREAALLRAYRNGTFFGSVAAIAADEQGRVVAPYDHSDFRFRRLTLRRDGQGRTEAVEVIVDGNDPELRPNIQVRFVTERGIVAVVDAAEAEFVIPEATDADPAPRFIRVEAFAYPDTHDRGKPLSAETMRTLGVAEIARLHDLYAPRGATFFGNRQEIRTPLPIVDQIFSQPITA